MFLVPVAGSCHIPVSGRLKLRDCQDQDIEEGEEEDGVGREEGKERKNYRRELARNSENRRRTHLKMRKKKGNIRKEDNGVRRRIKDNGREEICEK